VRRIITGGIHEIPPVGMYSIEYQKHGEKGGGRSIANLPPVMIPVFIDLLTAKVIRSFCEVFLLLPGAPRCCRGGLRVNAVMAEHSFLLEGGVVGWGLGGTPEVCARCRSK